MSDRFGDAVLAAYRGLGRVLAPALPLLLARRTRAGKEDPTRRGERLGRPAKPRPRGPLVWVHAASVGETVSVLALVERLIAAGTAVLVTTGTVTSAAIAAQRLPAGAFHQFVPFDVAPHLGRFLDHWRPGLAIFVESEMWPTTVLELADRAIPQVLVNARLSERSARRWGLVGGTARALFGRLAAALAQSPGDGARLAALGVGDVRVVGNLKYDGPPLGADPAEQARLAAAIGARPTWLAASTHPGEEAIAAQVHAAAAVHLPGLLTVIAPRHPVRGDEIRRELAGRGLTVASRSQGETPTAATDVFLADTIGEMGLLYRLVPIAFVGGSLADKGGQNPIEPARLGCAVIHGPSTRNFADVYRDLDAAGGATAITDAAGLAAAVVAAHGAPDDRAATVERARAVVAAATGALDRTMAALAAPLAAALAKDRE
ncbi:3-deoxy-D-manno-octulosonic acid transferase [Siculibacillus lacustris]|uniref:3-deoxy-D-manno-octulosonic acid transferase n=1 Tax=Siculibacillus lacustris TaxID=1549641 RepID=A0A4Q9VID7_9HYPH|nr:3-deoxy-D-manno-octulosonic acid transferase [Siculibacillus lacustris]TBW34981.1 3-deoxy-D-manno-octulosonic acid transferase [Siculibacillus lacustris]